MAEYIKIPEERLVYLLADGEKIKKMIESSTRTSIEIDQDTCEVCIEGRKDMDDPLAPWRARDVVKAIGRGFEPEIALELLDPNKELRIMELADYVGKAKNQLIRVRGRIIGTEGRSKRMIEETTGTHIVVYGKTVCIIGSLARVQVASDAIDRLLRGAMHTTVFKMLETASKKLNNNPNEYSQSR